MVRPVPFSFLALVAAAVAGCTVPAYTCGHPVPCARGSVQSCTSRDGARCRYLVSDGTPVECASCDDCFAAEREIAAWCAGDTAGVGGGDSAPPDLSSPDLPSTPPPDLSSTPPADMARTVDLAEPPRDLSELPPDDMASSMIDTDLGCYTFGYSCNGDPSCCAHCCAGGCTQFGFCALQ